MIGRHLLIGIALFGLVKIPASAEELSVMLERELPAMEEIRSSAAEWELVSAATPHDLVLPDGTLELQAGEDPTDARVVLSRRDVRPPFLLEFSFQSMDDAGLAVFFGKRERVIARGGTGAVRGVPSDGRGAAVHFVNRNQFSVMLADGDNEARATAEVVAPGFDGWTDVGILALPDRVIVEVDGERVIAQYGPYFFPDQSLGISAAGSSPGSSVRLRGLVLTVHGTAAVARDDDNFGSDSAGSGFFGRALAAIADVATSSDDTAANSAGAWNTADYARHTWRSFGELAELQQPIGASPNLPLFNAAIFYETNRIREEHGLPRFEHLPELEEAARGHSRAMAERGFFSHISPVYGMRAPLDRVRTTGLRFRMVAENILELHARYEPGEAPERTYAGLARGAVGAWMGSSDHRANILNPSLEFLGVGVAVRREDDERRYALPMTQNFTQGDD